MNALEMGMLPHPMIPLQPATASAAAAMIFSAPPPGYQYLFALPWWQQQPQEPSQPQLCDCFQLNFISSPHLSIVLWNVPQDVSMREVRNLFAFAPTVAGITPCPHACNSFLVGFTNRRDACEATAKLDNYLFEQVHPESSAPPVYLRATLVVPHHSRDNSSFDGDKNAPCDTLFLHHFQQSTSGEQLLETLQAEFGTTLIDFKFVRDRRGFPIGFVQFDSIHTAGLAKAFVAATMKVGCAYSANALHQRRY